MTPEERVRWFLDAMVAWEPPALRALLGGDRAERDAMTEQLRAIYDEHVSEKGRGPTRFGRNLVNSSWSVQDPPRFDQDIDHVLAGKKSVVYVIARPRKDPYTAWRFTVSPDATGTPRIDDLHGIAVSPGKPLGTVWKKFGY